MGGGKGSKDYTDTGSGFERDPETPNPDVNNNSRRERPVVVKLNSASVMNADAQRVVNNFFKQLPKVLTEKPSELPDNLNQVVIAKKVPGTGKTEYEYSPRPLSGTTTARSGGLSVSQTSLSERAHAAFADAEKRLRALKPMRTPHEPEDLDALRAVTLGAYKRLVNEMARGDGPRVGRVDDYFFVLIGKQDDTSTDFTLHKNSLLGRIESDFELDPNDVNTPEDSANLANFRITKENLFDVFRSWRSFKKNLGSDFVQLSAQFSRRLASIESDVTEVETAMDEFGFEAADRESEPVPGRTETIDGLLSWIKEFATHEAPELIENGGRIGIEATKPTLIQLDTLVGELVKSSLFKDTDVKPSLDSLKERLSTTLLLAKQIAPDRP